MFKDRMYGVALFIFAIVNHLKKGNFCAVSYLRTRGRLRTFHDVCPWGDDQSGADICTLQENQHIFNITFGNSRKNLGTTFRHAEFRLYFVCKREFDFF